MISPDKKHNKENLPMPRQTTSQTQEKPTMPFQVEYVPMGTNTTRHFNSGNPKNAVDIAVSVLSHGATNLKIRSWTKEDGWKEDATLMQRTLDRVAGVGNAQAVEALKQLAEYNGAMIRDTQKRNGANQELLALWLSQVFTSARSLGVVPRTIQEIYGVSYQGYQEPAPPVPSEVPA